VSSYQIHTTNTYLSVKDLNTFEAHVVRVAAAGVGILIAGSMGEGIHLTRLERITLVNAGRRALDAAGFPHVPIVVGTGAGSTKETIEICCEAENAGADYAIVIVSGYFAMVLAQNRQAIMAFYKEISEESPIPVMIYNCGSLQSGFYCRL
jgi:4-hydroxy-2-oxoglutarate aldolase